MCDQCRCSSTAQQAAAKYQQLKASWGVAAQTPAKELRLEPGRIRHEHQVFDAVWWMLDLATPLISDSKHPEISVWLKKHVDISELQMAYLPNESAKKQQTNNLTLLKSPYLRFAADQSRIWSRHFLMYAGLTAAASSARSEYVAPVNASTLDGRAGSTEDNMFQITWFSDTVCKSP